MRQYSPMDIEERAAEARAFLNSPAMRSIFDDLKEEYLQQLIQAEVGGLTAATAHASIKVLEDIRGKMQSMINDQTFHRKTGR